MVSMVSIERSVLNVCLMCVSMCAADHLEAVAAEKEMTANLRKMALWKVQNRYVTEQTPASLYRLDVLRSVERGPRRPASRCARTD
jgi:hypothetical protein